MRRRDYEEAEAAESWDGMLKACEEDDNWLETANKTMESRMSKTHGETCGNCDHFCQTDLIGDDGDCTIVYYCSLDEEEKYCFEDDKCKFTPSRWQRRKG